MSYWQKISKLIVTLVLLGAIIGQVTPNVIAGSALSTQTVANSAIAESGQLEQINQAVNSTPSSESTSDSSSEASSIEDEANDESNTTDNGSVSENPTEEVSENDVVENETEVANSEETETETEVDPAADKDSKAALEGEPAAPTSADGVKKASSKGMVFIVALRNGFINQPQTEQYVVEGSEVNLDSQVIEMGIPILGSNPKIEGYMWEYNQTTKSWHRSETPTVKTTANGLISSRYNAKLRYVDGNALQPGYYYFQFRYTKSSLLGTNYYSKLVKVVVLEGEVPATDLSITPESPVVFPSMDYEAKANLTPSNSTSVVAWDDNSQVDFEPNAGRSVDFNVNKSVIASNINTSTENPGLPITLAANTNGLNADTTVYVGGLKAKSIAIDQAELYGMTWSVSGLDKITKEFYESDVDEQDGLEAPPSANYSWKYFYKNDKGKFVSADIPGAINGSGQFTNPNELNTTQLLTIPPGAVFFNAASVATSMNDDFYAQLTITLNYKKNPITITTNLAQIEVRGRMGNLTLEAVPNFTFVGVTAAQIYNGNLTTPGKQPVSQGDTENTLSIMDTRPNDQDWQLSAEMAPFADRDGQTFNNLGLRLNGLTDTGPVINADGTEYAVLNNTQHASGEFPVTANLLIGTNPTAQLQENLGFTSTITWNLTSSTPTSPAL